MTNSEKIQERKDFIAKYPQHKEEIMDMWCLMLNEISEGESPENEYTNYLCAVNDIINGNID